MEHLRHFLQHVGGSLFMLSHLRAVVFRALKAASQRRLSGHFPAVFTSTSADERAGLPPLKAGRCCAAACSPGSSTRSFVRQQRVVGDGPDITHEGWDPLQWQRPNGQMMDDSFPRPTWLPFIHVHHHLSSSKSLTTFLSPTTKRLLTCFGAYVHYSFLLIGWLLILCGPWKSIQKNTPHCSNLLYKPSFEANQSAPSFDLVRVGLNQMLQRNKHLDKPTAALLDPDGL